MEKLRVLLICALLFVSTTISAQILEGHYLPFGLGYVYSTVKDQALSPVSYSGNLGSISGGYHYYNSKWISAFDISGFGAIIHPNVNRDDNPNSALAISARANYSLSRKVFEKNDWHFFAGIISQNFWDYRDVRRYSNSNFNFDAFFSLGPIITIQKPFSLWKQNFGIQYTLAVPVVTYAWRPGYIKPLLAGKISNKEFYSWGDYYNLDSRTELYWKVSHDNYIKLSYQWEYTQLNPINKLQMANHILTLSTLFKF